MLAHFSRPADSRSHHLALLSLFGIGYFLLWPYLQFYLKLTGADPSNNQLIYASLIAGIVLISLLPQVRNIKREFAYVLVVVFFATTGSGFIFDREIKNNLSEWVGFFSTATAKADVNENWKWYRDDIAGVTFQIPDYWAEQKHSSGLTYFTFNKESNKIAELRLHCFHNTELSVAEIVFNVEFSNTSQGLTTKAECSRSISYECLVKTLSSDNKTPEKWRWLKMERNMQQNVQIDFLFFTDDKSVKREAKKIINSAKLLKIQDELSSCISTIDWI